MKFDDSQIAELSAPLSREHVKSREQGGRKLSYIEGWVVIKEANRIFGFDGWARETIEFRCVSEREREIGQSKAPGWGVTYIAKVRITVGDIIREGCGTGHGIDRDLGQAHESALKEAETDAMKRSFMTFGNPFGLALYDKEQAEVTPTAPKAPRAEPPKSSAHKPAIITPEAQKTAALAWADKAITACLGFRKPDMFDEWYTEDTRNKIASIAKYDAAKHAQVLRAVDDCLDRFNPIAAG